MARRNSRGLEPAGGQRWLSGRGSQAQQVVLLMTALDVCAWPCHGQTPTAKDPGAAEAPATAAWTSLGLGGGGAMYTPAISPVDPNLILLDCDMSGVLPHHGRGRELGADPLSATDRLVHRVSPAWHPDRGRRSPTRRAAGAGR